MTQSGMRGVAADGATLPLTPTPEEIRLRDAVATVTRGFGPDYYQSQAESGGAGTEFWKALADNGFAGIHLPARYGGGGLGLYALSMVVEEAAAGGVPPLAVLFSSGVTGSILARHGTCDQCENQLRGLATGKVRSAFAITEADAGTNPHAITTSARRQGAEYVLRGRKIFVTGADAADFLVVAARTGTDRGALSLFIVDTHAPGLRLTPIRTEMRAPERTFTVHLDDVPVTADHLVGVENRGLQAAFSGMNAERLLVSSICTGLGRYALGKAVRRARERRVWDTPIGSHQALAHPLARAKIALESARLMTARACRLYDLGIDPGVAGTMAKLVGVDAGTACLDAAIQTYGGHGVATESQLSNYWFLLRTLRIGPVSHEMILNFVAEHSLGLPKSY